MLKYPHFIALFSSYFPLKKKKKLILRIVTLQYCGGFPHTSVWIRHRHTCVPFILNPPPPSRLSGSTSSECPVSYVKLALVIYFTYGSVYISVLFSQSSNPLLCPLSPKVSSLYLCLLCCPACRIIITTLLNSIYIYVCVNIRYLFFSF